MKAVPPFYLLDSVTSENFIYHTWLLSLNLKSFPAKLHHLFVRFEVFSSMMEVIFGKYVLSFLPFEFVLSIFSSDSPNDSFNSPLHVQRIMFQWTIPKTWLETTRQKSEKLLLWVFFGADGVCVGVDAASSWMDSLLVSHQPPSLLPPPSSSLRAEEHKLSNTSTAAHTSSVLQLFCLHTERFHWAHNKHTHTHCPVLTPNKSWF